MILAGASELVVQLTGKGFTAAWDERKQPDQIAAAAPEEQLPLISIE